MALNDQKAAFAKAKVIDGLSNRLAAIAAGYSEKTASAAGARLSKDEAVLEEIDRLRREGLGEPLSVQAPPQPPVIEPVSSAEVAQDLVGLSDRGLRLQQAGVLKVRGFVVEIDGRSFDVLQNPKDQADLCRIGLIKLDANQRDMTKASLPYHHGKVADMGKKEVAEQNARAASGGLFSPMEAPLPRQGVLC